MTETRAEPFTPAERAVMAARAEAAEWRARYEDVAQSAQAQRWLEAARERAAMREVVDAAEAWATCGGDALEDYALRRELRRAVAALRAAREGK